MAESRGIAARIERSWLLRALYRHPIDVLPTTLQLAVFAAQLCVLFWVDSLLSTALAAVLLFPVQVNFGGTCHNHHHLHTFRQRSLNRAFEVVMFLQLGMLPYGYTLHHNLGHHTRYLDPVEDPNRWCRADGTAMGAWEFAWRLCWRMYPEVLRIGRYHPVVLWKFLRMAALCFAVLGALALVDPARAAILFLAPLPFALLLQAQATYYQHAGLRSSEPLHATRSALGRLYNWRTGNLGYHHAHHLKPGLHWSKLPGLHARLASRIPEELIL